MLLRSLLAALALSTPALAQDVTYDGGMNGHGFVLSPQDGDVRDAYALHRPGTMYGGTWFAGGVFEYANKPLVLIRERQGDVLSSDALLDHVLGLNLSAGVAPHERFRFSASVPLYFTSTSLENAQGAGLGDLRLDAMILIVSPDDERGFGLGLVPWIDLPTGSTAKFLGRNGVGGGGALAASVGFERATLLANLGAQFDPEVEDLINMTGSDSLVAGVGANYLVSEHGSLGLETRFFVPFQSNEESGTGSPSEAILSYRRSSEKGGFFSMGGAAPLSAGAGAAAFRVFVGGGFGKTGEGPPRDRDGDGFVDDEDSCVDEPETVNEFKDDDGCPDELPTLSVKVVFDGAQVEGADLSVTQGEAEPMMSSTTASAWRTSARPGSSWALAANKADCLFGEATAKVEQASVEATVPMKLVPSADLKIFVHDEAGKPVAGTRLAWESGVPGCLPAEIPTVGEDGRAAAQVGPGQHTLVVTAEGYRMVEQPVKLAKGANEEVDITLVAGKTELKAKRIAILDKVEFETDKAVIRIVSNELLDEVSAVIRRNPQAGRVEVQGHTDSDGGDDYNLGLSQRRAAAVLQYLVNKGVKRDRLIAKGYGESKPIATNGTADGKARNRRVEFVLIDQTSEVIEEGGD